MRAINDMKDSHERKLILSRVLGHDLDIDRPEEKEWNILTK